VRGASCTSNAFPVAATSVRIVVSSAG